VTMDDEHTVIEDGSVLVRKDRIIALWQGKQPPFGNAGIVDFGPSALIFPGMINLHATTQHLTCCGYGQHRRRMCRRGLAVRLGQSRMLIVTNGIT
jgi:imidazolonepropionase-like amidohydrolase